MKQIYYLGIDPSLRNTGVILMDEDGNVVLKNQISPTEEPVLQAALVLRTELIRLLTAIKDKTVVVSMEKQLYRANSSPTLFYVQMLIAEELHRFLNSPQKPIVMVSPLPVQLKSYISRQKGVDITSKSTIVEGWKKAHLYKGRISQHLVEASYLAELAKDVMNGQWKYTVSDKDLPLFPWKITGAKE